MKVANQLNKLLSEGLSGNQTRLVELLRQRGIKTTQSTVSRALKKINAVKGTDKTGNIIYTLPKKQQSGNDAGFFGSLVYQILDNGHLIVIHTRPGTANTVAKFIDDQSFGEVMGTVAGDDTIMIVPSDVKKTNLVKKKIQAFLAEIGIL